MYDPILFYIVQFLNMFFFSFTLNTVLNNTDVVSSMVLLVIIIGA